MGAACSALREVASSSLRIGSGVYFRRGGKNEEKSWGGRGREGGGEGGREGEERS
jgi:hypothetical protein